MSGAAAGKAIGAMFDDVRMELSRVTKQSQVVPTALQISQVKGASHGSAAKFHTQFTKEMSIVAERSVQLQSKLDKLEFAVHDALEAIAEHDADAKAIVDEFTTAVDQSSAPGITSPSAPATVQTPTSRSGYGA